MVGLNPDVDYTLLLDQIILEKVNSYAVVKIIHPSFNHNGVNADVECHKVGFQISKSHNIVWFCGDKNLQEVIKRPHHKALVQQI